MAPPCAEVFEKNGVAIGIYAHKASSKHSTLYPTPIALSVRKNQRQIRARCRIRHKSAACKMEGATLQPERALYCCEKGFAFGCERGRRSRERKLRPTDRAPAVAQRAKNPRRGNPGDRAADVGETGCLVMCDNVRMRIADLIALTLRPELRGATIVGVQAGCFHERFLCCVADYGSSQNRYRPRAALAVNFSIRCRNLEHRAQQSAGHTGGTFFENGLFAVCLIGSDNISTVCGSSRSELFQKDASPAVAARSDASVQNQNQRWSRFATVTGLLTCTPNFLNR